MRVAIQGETGSFHHEATKRWFGLAIEIVPAKTFGEVFKAVKHGEADAGIVAVENSLYGSINEVLDLIEMYRYPIVGEVFLRIEQQLITLPGAVFKTIERVYSHPVALAQCTAYLDAHLPHAERIEYSDTSASVAYVKQLADPTVAAIAGRGAAELHGLPILAENIEDNKENFTRFLVIDPHGNHEKQTNKVSFVLTTPPSARRARSYSFGICQCRNKSDEAGIPANYWHAMEIPLLYRRRSNCRTVCWCS